MIVTVTANPSLDQTLQLDVFVHGGVNRVRSTLREPSGKGVNVSLALQSAGTPTTAVLPLGGPTGVELEVLLAATGLTVRPVAVEGTIRSNLSLVEADGSTTKVNEPGPRLTAAETARLVEQAMAASGTGDWIAFCGSLPDGFPAARLGEAVREARAAGRQVAVDTSEAPLVTLLDGPRDQLPTVVKPNTHELATATGRSLHTLGEVVAAAQLLLDRGVQTVLVSMGGDGALLLDRTGAVHGVAPVPRVVNTVGAGDAFLAGYLHARHGDDDARTEALVTALRWGALAVQHPGTVFPGPDPFRGGSGGSSPPGSTLLDPAARPTAVRIDPVTAATTLTEPAHPKGTHP